jgi:hypothetical protein
VGDRSVEAAAGTSAALTIAGSSPWASSPAVDVLFLLDATGSMGDEIGQLTDNIDTVASHRGQLRHRHL